MTRPQPIPREERIAHGTALRLSPLTVALSIALAALILLPLVWLRLHSARQTESGPHWSYRVMRTPDGRWGVYEVHFGADGCIIGWSERPVIAADTLDDPRWTIERLPDALNHTPLDESGEEIKED